MSLLQERLTEAGLYGQSQEAFYAELLGRVRDRLLTKVDAQLIFFDGQARVAQELRQAITASLGEEEPGLPAAARGPLVDRLFNDLVGYGPIQALVEDPTVTEIMVNRFDEIWVERAGRLEREPGLRFTSDRQVRDLCERIAAPLRRRIDEAQPLLDGRLPDGSRVNAVLGPTAVDGTCLTIRKFVKALSVERLQELGTLSAELTGFLKQVVQARLNVIVSGGTSSGKTALLNALASYIPVDERIITVEDAAELRLQQPHVVRLETRPPNVEGKGELGMRELLRNALRMRPDRIIVGECRGAEALDMVQANNTGHEGGFTTLHANSPADALARLETLVLLADSGLSLRAIRQQLASAFDLIIGVGRLRSGQRRVLRISEVGPLVGDEVTLIDLFVYEPTTDQVIATGAAAKRLAAKAALWGVTPCSD